MARVGSCGCGCWLWLELAVMAGVGDVAGGGLCCVMVTGRWCHCHLYVDRRGAAEGHHGQRHREGTVVEEERIVVEGRCR